MVSELINYIVFVLLNIVEVGSLLALTYGYIWVSIYVETKIDYNKILKHLAYRLLQLILTTCYITELLVLWYGHIGVYKYSIEIGLVSL